jgi:predicted metal-dependent phosphoesterase TrpH
MVQRLASLGAPVAYARVEELAGTGAIGRPHVARALLEAGHVRDIGEAFDRYIGRHGPAYVERVKVTPAQAVQIIRAAGGLAVLANPGWGTHNDMIPELVSAGLDGVEAYYPDHTPSQVEQYLGIAKASSLLVTGGTDFHGSGLATRVAIGSQYVPDGVVEPLRAAAARRTPSPHAPDLPLAVE